MHECLVDALVAAKVAFAPVLKTRSAKIKSGKGDFGYKYASLEDVIEAVEGALTTNGIAQLQRMAVRDGHQLLVTELRWKGEVIAAEMILPLEGLDPQGCGKVISYYRRYALQALLGITAEDDDATDTQHVRQPAAKPAPEPEPAPHPMFAGLLDQALAASNGAELAAVVPHVRDAWPDLIVSDRHTAGRIKALMRDKAAEFGLDLSTV